MASPYYTKTQVDSKTSPLKVYIQSVENEVIETNERVYNLELEVDGIADGTGGKGYPDITTAMAVTPLPTDGTIFTIDYDNGEERGIYRYDSSESGGYAFIRSFDATGVVEEGNIQAVSGGEVYNKITDFTIKSYNLVNYNNFTGGDYRIDSSNKVFLSPSNNRLSVKVDNINELTKYNLQGIGSMAPTIPFIIYSNDTNVNLGYINFSDFSQDLETPAGTTTIYINIANEINIGINPTDNIYVNLTQLTEGEEEKPFLKHGGIFVKTLDIIDEKNQLPLNSDAVINELSKIIDQSYNLIDYNNFEGGSYIVGSSTNIVNLSTASLNWLSVKVPITENTEYYLQGLDILDLASHTPIVIYGTSSDLFISEVQKGDFNGVLNSPPNASYMYIRIANAVGIGINPTSNNFVNTVQLTEGGEEKPFQKYNSIYIKESVLPNNNKKDYPNFFIELFPVTENYNGVLFQKTVANIYEKLSGNKYVKHSLRYEKLDYSDFVSGDFLGGEVVRYFGAILSNYDEENNSFTDTSTVFIRTLESEFVLSAGGWSGGYHGNEDMESCFFMIDGKPYNDGTMIFEPLGLTPCNSFNYIFKSKLILHSDKSDICDRLKVCEFKDGGYNVRTKLKGLSSVNALMYPGICCVDKMFNNIISDTSNKYTYVSDNNYLVDGDKFSRTYYYSNNDYSLNISAKIINDENIDKNAEVLIWDRPSDTKYYRRVSSYNFEINKTIEFEQFVSIMDNETSN
jgi:hypothetical protein